MKKLITTAIVLSALLAGGTVYANRTSTQPTVQTNTATSSPTQLFPINGSSTTSFLTYDSYCASSSCTTNEPQIADGATLLIQQLASSTTSVTDFAVQYSQDGVDWYKDSVNLTATTSSVVGITPSITYRWTAATTTVDGRAIVLKTPTRYIRVQATQIAATSSVWMQIVGRKEIRE